MKIALLTSGGDAPGMNPAVRAVARSALAAGAEVLAVREGYEGLVQGWVDALSAADVGGLLDRGGTVLGTARSAAFRGAEGRRAAVATLVNHGAEGLIVIGGDGSLTGASILSTEWAEHLRTLVADGVVTEEQAAAHPRLRVVGLVGSIDNDFWGTDTTIGGDTALHRVIEAIDALTSTASSHQRSFVVEVMGRRCGWLALAASICTGADAVLLPEAPPPDWRTYVLASLEAGRAAGRRHSVVIVAEGARDRSGQPITAGMVQEVLRDVLHQDTRITVLGHVQRGGAPSGFDRIMTTTLGVRAVQEMLEGDDRAIVFGTCGPDLVRHDLDEAVRMSRAASDAAGTGDHERARDLRGDGFEALISLRHILGRPAASPPESAPAVLVLHVGAPAPGMNAVVASVARGALARGWRAIGASDGLRGLLAGDTVELDWMAVDGWVNQGGAALGTNRHPVDAALVVPRLQALGVRSVVLVGGFESIGVAEQLCAQGVPVAIVPATISNNLPGTWRSVGSDTACNAVLEAVDRLRQSAVGARDRVFVVEVMGRRCAALAAASALGSGAELVFVHEDEVDLAQVERASRSLNADFDAGRAVGLVLVADGVDAPYDARSLSRVLEAESGGRFDTRLCVLGHLQQGGRPAPMDRLDGARLGDAAVRWCVEGGTDAVLVGLEGEGVAVVPLPEVLAASDPVHRRPREPGYAGVLALARRLGLGLL